MGLFIISEVLFFRSFFWAYFHSRLRLVARVEDSWPLRGVVRFNPFEVPGTLQSNMIKLLSIDPYFEQNIKQLSSFETSILLLFHEIVIDGEMQGDFQLLIERIDTLAFHHL